jgi:hypothetical protein
MTGDRALCPNVSFYRRPCTLQPHGWTQSCQFGPDPDPDEDLPYDLENGSTLRDLLEALSAGGPTGIDAAMRWVEYRLYRDARDAERDIGGIIAQVRNGSVAAAQTEREIIKQYLEQRIPAAATPAPAWGPASLTDPCLGGCGDPSPHDGHLKPGALEYLAGEGANGAQLGLATTRRLLIELQARGAPDCPPLETAAFALLETLPPDVLAYRTVDS